MLETSEYLEEAGAGGARAYAGCSAVGGRCTSGATGELRSSHLANCSSLRGTGCEILTELRMGNLKPNLDLRRSSGGV
jgi:hypothetical protein